LIFPNSSHSSFEIDLQIPSYTADTLNRTITHIKISAEIYDTYIQQEGYWTDLSV